MKNITFINAGAGSGKTTKLTKILTEKIVKNEVTADQVILTTFTEIAAAEFRGKAREALMKADRPDQANLLAAAAMGTVHAVAYQMIQRFWYRLNLGVDLSVMPVEDVHFFINQALGNIPTEQELIELRKITDELYFVNDKGFINYDAWKDDLLKIIEMALNNQFEDLQASKRGSLELLQYVYQPGQHNMDPDRIKNTLRNLLEVLQNAADNPTSRGRISDVEGYLDKIRFTIQDYIQIHSFFGKLPQGVQNNTEGFAETLDHMNHLYHSATFIQPLERYIKLLFDLAERSMAEYSKYKQENNLIDFNDMEVYLLKLLAIKEVHEEIKETYKLVFVDEFQDSSPAQIRIFDKLSEIVEHSYWVGDPKQAIYNFRGTDPQLIKAIIDKFGPTNNDGLSIDNLPKSWRSRESIVDLTNNIFQPALSSQVHPDHIALEAIRKDDELPDRSVQKPLQHWHFENDGGTNKDILNHHLSMTLSDLVNGADLEVVDKNKSKYSESEGAVKVVTQDLKPGHIAVLNRTNSALTDRVEAFKQAGLTVAAEQSGLMETAEVKLLQALLNYFLDETDSLAKAVILFLTAENMSVTSLLNERLEFLNKAPENPEELGEDLTEEQKELKKKFHDYMNAWGEENEILKKIDEMRREIAILPVPGILERILLETGLSDIMMRWDNPLQRRNNLTTMIRLAESYDQRCLLLNLGATVGGYLDYLNDRDINGLKQSAAAGDDAINLLTYHKSKGLEWPVVILCDLTYDHLSDTNTINKNYFGVRIDNPETIDISDPFAGKRIIVMPWPFGKRNRKPPQDLKNRITGSDRYKQIYKEDEDEMKRLLYVGMTRARDILITVTFKDREPFWLNTVLPDKNIISDLRALNVGENTLDLFEKECSINVNKIDFGEDFSFPEFEHPDQKVYARKEAATQDDPKYKSPSSEEGNREAVIEVAKDFEYGIGITDSLKDRERELGDCLHDCFYLYQQHQDKEKYLEKIKKVIENHNLKGNLTHPEHIYDSIKHLYEYLTGEYGNPIRIFRELPLQMEEEGCVYRGEADLLWETEKDLILVDYKSLIGNKQHIQNREHALFAGKHAGQLGRYKKMIEGGHQDGKQVTELLIYYAVSGLIVRMNQTSK